MSSTRSTLHPHDWRDGRCELEHRLRRWLSDVTPVRTNERCRKPRVIVCKYYDIDQRGLSDA